MLQVDSEPGIEASKSHGSYAASEVTNQCYFFTPMATIPLIWEIGEWSLVNRFWEILEDDSPFTAGQNI